MKVAYTGWTWLINHKDNYQWEFEQFLKEVSDLGYEAVENFAFITRYFENDAAAVRALTDRYGLELVNLYLHFSPDPAVDWENAQNYVNFMKGTGSTYLNMQGVMWKEPPNERPTDDAQICAYAELSNRIGKLCKDNGMQAVFHPHFNTAVFREGEIDRYLSLVNPDLVSLCLDTAHTMLAGMDVVKAFDKYGDRIGYVHLKDVDPDESVHPEWPIKRFLPLGCGTIDFKGVLKVLRQHGYDGVLCVELDQQPVCNYKSAMISRRYIHDALG